MFLTPLQVEWRMKLNRGQRYVFTPNHSSYLDIPVVLHAIPGFINFVGKSDLCKVPLWGKVYEQLYISVDRKSATSSARSYIKSVKTLEEGRSLVIFPEGTIPKTAGKELMAFKDGPFRIAIEKQLPVVPVTMPYNQHFLPDLDGKLKVRWHPLKIVVHEPIETKGLTLEDLPQLKEQVSRIIQTELEKHNKVHVNRYSNHPQDSALSEARV